MADDDYAVCVCCDATIYGYPCNCGEPEPEPEEPDNLQAAIDAEQDGVDAAAERAAQQGKWPRG